MVPAPTPAPPPRRVSYVLPPPTAPPPLLGFPPLSAPRRGQTNPLYTVTDQYADNSRHQFSDGGDAHPRHRLAVQALALDFSTAVSHDHDGAETQDTSPGGILYTGGRDGLLCSWELNLPAKRRRRAYGQSEADELDEDENEEAVDDDEDDEANLGPVGALELEGVGALPQSTVTNGKGRSLSTATARMPPGNADLPLQHRWEVDHAALGERKAAPRASFRQCVQSHTDWVNDIVLANYNRTLVSASSDSSILAWHPHSTDHHDQMTPTAVGRHADYVRCLATGLDTNWVASGGFDRKIKLWDVGEGRPNAPIVELPSPPASVYSLGTTSSGSLIAAGTPERIVRVWDPRSRKQVSRLGGHTDNVRAVLLADDGKWLLSASSDSTVKLWSLAAQKCLHTFSHHASSVWSLFSQHSSLEIFYSGDRDGNLCKVDFAGTGEPTEGECILLARDGPEEPSDRIGTDEITQMVAQDDAYVWTVGGSSSVKRWKDVPTKLQRARAIVRRAKEDGDDAVAAEMRSSASPVLSDAVASPVEMSPSPMAPASPPVRERPPSHSVSFLEGLTAPLARTSSSPTPKSPSQLAQIVSSAHRPSSLRASRLSVTTSSRPTYEHLITNNPKSLCDIPYDSLVPLTLPEETYFAPAFASRYRDPDAATIYSTVSKSSGPHRPSLPYGHSSSYRRTQSIAETSHDATNVAQRDYFRRESVAEAVPLRTEPDDVIEGGYGLVRCELLNDRQHALTQDTEDGIALWNVVRGTCVGVFAPNQLSDALSMRRPSDLGSTSGISAGGSVRSGGHGADVLEFVRERIEGEVSIATWCKCDTRVGALTVHLEEPRVFDAEAYIEECGVGPLEDYPPDHRLCLGKWVLRQLFDGFIEAEMSQRMPGSSAASTSNGASSDDITSMGYVSLSDGPPMMSPRARGPRTPGMTIALATPAAKRAVLPDLPAGAASLMSPRFGQTELAPIPQSPAPYTPMPMAGMANAGGKTPTRERPEADYFSLRPSVPTESASNMPASPTMSSRTSEPPTPGATNAPLPTPGGGNFMGRLRMLGKNQKKGSTDVQPIATPTLQQVIEDNRPLEVRQQEFILETVFSRPLAPCPLIDAPRLSYDPDMAVIISEESSDAWSVKYRGLVGTSYEDVPVLEQNAPLWLLDFLLGNRTTQKEPVKVSFVLQAWKGDESRSLPEMPNANARLTANRSLRVRKVCSYVADKLNLRAMSRAPSIADGLSSYSTSPSEQQAQLTSDYNPETGIEVLVNGEVIPTNVTIGTVRHCMWKSGGDVVFTYRLKEARAV